MLIFGIGLLLISTSWVQSGILKQFTQTFEEATNQEITLQSRRALLIVEGQRAIFKEDAPWWSDVEAGDFVFTEINPPAR